MQFSKIHNYVLTERGAEFSSGSHKLWVEFVAPDIVRIRFAPRGAWIPEDTYVVERVPRFEVTVETRVEDGEVHLLSPALQVCVRRDPFSLEVRDNAGRTVFAAPEGAIEADNERIVQRIEYAPEERICGLGQGTHPHLDLRDQERRIWHEVRSARYNCSAGIPFMLSSRGYGLLLNSSYPARFAIGRGEVAPPPTLERQAHFAPAPWSVKQHSGEANPERIAILLDHTQLDYFLVCRGTWEAILQGYVELAGKPVLLPKWALGYIQCRNRYRSQDELLEVARTCRSKGIPTDVMVIDWLWFKVFGDLSWDRKGWPEPRRMAKELGSMGFRLMQAQHPYVNKPAMTWNEFTEKGYLIEFPEEMKRLKNQDSIFDFSNPQARAEWWNKVRPLFDDGIRAYWADMVQPEIHPVGSRHYMGSREKVHNIYGLLVAKALYDGQRSYSNERVFSLTFAGYAGIQRYGAAMWSGDVDPSWEVLRDQIIVGQQVSLSGLPYWTTDQGGYVPYRFYDPELFIRWLQWGVFCPVCRTHTKRPENEPWAFGPHAEEIITQFIRLRYTLLPYLYTQMRCCHETGMPMMRAMALAFPHDQEAVARELQFMFGPHMLIAPVAEHGARSQEVYLPEGVWYDWWTDEKYKGKSSMTAFVPLDRIPIYVKGGSIIPLAPDMLHTDERPLDPLILQIYPGADCEFELYEDDGTTYEYEGGRYARTSILYRETMGTVVVGPTRGEYRGQLHTRAVRIVLHDHDMPVGVWLNGVSILDQTEAERGWKYHESTRCLEIMVPSHALAETTFVQVAPPRRHMPNSKHVRDRVRRAPMALWADACRPDERRGIIHAYLADVTGSDEVTWTLTPPPGWRVESGPTPGRKQFAELETASWTLEGIGPDYTPFQTVGITASLVGTEKETHIALGSGYASHWRIVGSFPNPEGKGFDTEYEPERRVDLAATYRSGDGQPIVWQCYNGLDSVGYVNLIGLLENAYGPTPSTFYKVTYRLAYAAGSVWSPDERACILELMGEDRFKVWVNGALVILAPYPPSARPTRGMLTLRAGWNTFLVKSTQDATPEWGGRRWGFYLRLLDLQDQPMRDTLFRADWCQESTKDLDLPLKL